MNTEVLNIILMIAGFLASAITIIGFVYGILRNFKNDINGNIDSIGRRLDGHAKNRSTIHYNCKFIKRRKIKWTGLKNM